MLRFMRVVEATYLCIGTKVFGDRRFRCSGDLLCRPSAPPSRNTRTRVACLLGRRIRVSLADKMGLPQCLLLHRYLQ